MKKLKQLAKEAYNSKEVCQEWKDKILEAYPEVNTKPKGWYKASNNKKWLSYFDGERYLYGFNGYGNWVEYKKHEALSKIEPTDYLATEEEVSEALIKEAKIRGYKVGDKLRLSFIDNIPEYVVYKKTHYSLIDYLLKK